MLFPWQIEVEGTAAPARRQTLAMETTPKNTLKIYETCLCTGYA